VAVLFGVLALVCPALRCCGWWPVRGIPAAGRGARLHRGIKNRNSDEDWWLALLLGWSAWPQASSPSASRPDGAVLVLWRGATPSSPNPRHRHGDPPAQGDPRRVLRILAGIVAIAFGVLVFLFRGRGAGAGVAVMLATRFLTGVLLLALAWLIASARKAPGTASPPAAGISFTHALRRWFVRLLAVVIVGGLSRLQAQLCWGSPRWTKRGAARPIAARGDLAADEKATIELFERSKARWCTSPPPRACSICSRATSSPFRRASGRLVWDERGTSSRQPRHRERRRGARAPQDRADYNATLVARARARPGGAAHHRRHRPRRRCDRHQRDLKVGRVFAIGTRSAWTGR